MRELKIPSGFVLDEEPKLPQGFILDAPEKDAFKNGDYDYDSANAAGIKPDKTGHWASRVPSGKNEGLLLKSEDHPTFQKTLKGEQDAGYTIYRNKENNRLYSFNKQPGDKFKEENIPTVELTDKQLDEPLTKPSYTSGENFINNGKTDYVHRVPLRIQNPRLVDETIKQFTDKGFLFDNPNARHVYYKSLYNKGYDVSEVQKVGEKFAASKQFLTENQLTPELQGNTSEPSMQKKYQIADALQGVGKHEDATKLYEQLIKEAPATPEYYSGMAKSVDKLGNKQMADQLNQKAQEFTTPNIPSIDEPNPQAQEMKDIAGAIESTIPGVGAVKGAEEGVDQIAKGLEMIGEGKYAKGSLKAIAGAASGGISYLMNTTPIGLGFQQAFKTKSDIETVYPNSPTKQLDWIFTPLAKAGEQYEKRTGNKVSDVYKDTAIIGDAILGAIMLHPDSYRKVYETAKKLKSGEPVTKAEAQDLQDEIAKQKVKPENAEVAQKTEQVNELKNYAQQNQDIAPILQGKIDGIDKEINDIHQTQADRDIEDAFKEGLTHVLTTEKSILEEKLKTAPEIAQEDIKNKISEINKQIKQHGKKTETLQGGQEKTDVLTPDTEPVSPVNELGQNDQPQDPIKIAESVAPIIEALPTKKRMELAILTGDKGNVVRKNKIAAEYAKAKIDGSNPELVKAVEELLPKPIENAVQEPSPEKVLPGEPQEDGSKGSESGGVGEGNQGEEAPQTSEEKEVGTPLITNEGAQPDNGEPTGVKFSTMKQERAARGASDLTDDVNRLTPEQAIEMGKKARAEGLDVRALASSLEKNPRPLTVTEKAAAIDYKAELENKIYQASKEVNNAIDDGAKLVVQEKLNGLLEDRDTFDRMNRKTGYEESLTFSLRKVLMDSEMNAQYQIEKYKANNNGTIPKAVEEKFNKLQKEYDELKIKMQDYESKQQKKRGERAIKNIKAEVEREKPVLSAEKAARKALLAKKFAGVFHDITDIPRQLADKEFREYAGLVLEEAVGDFKKFAAKIIANVGKGIRDHLPQLYKELGGEGEPKIDDILPKPTIEDGNLKIPHDLIREIVKKGVDNIEDLVTEVKKFIEEPVSDREVRDAITKYGKTVNLSKEEIEVKLRKIKRIGRLSSALEDVRSGKWPLRSGLQRDKITDIEKQMQSEVKELMKALPEDQAETEKEWRTNLESFKTRMQTLKDKYESDLKKLKEGTYKKPEKKELILDDEAIGLRAHKNKIRDEFQTTQKFLERKKRSGVEKLLDVLAKMKREMVISSVTTMAKLGTAGTMRMIQTPLEEAAGQVFHLLFPSLSQKASRHGGGWNVQAETAAIKKFGSTWANLLRWKGSAKDVITEGKSELDRAFGEKTLPEEFVSYVGRIHGAIKDPVKQAEYVRSLRKRLDSAVNQGLDIENPAVMKEIVDAAYIDGRSAIFTNKNAMTEAFRNFTGFMEKRKSLAAKLSAPAAKILFPVVSVPTNFINEVLKLQPFAPHATAKFLQVAWKKVMHNTPMSPGEADYIMKALKKQSIGGAFYMLGYYNPNVFGGYYTGKRTEGDLEAGDFSPTGTKIPHWLLHFPLMEAMQMGATLRRIQDEYESKGKAEGTKAGILKGYAGALEQVPFIEEPGKVSDVMHGDVATNAEKFIGELAASQVIPPDLAKIAQVTDKDQSGKEVKRRVETAGDVIKSKIPGWRKTLPRKTVAVQPDIEMMFKDKKYNKSSFNVKSIMTNEKARTLTRKDILYIDSLRNEKAQDVIHKNMEYLNTLENDEFKRAMDAIYAEATSDAKDQFLYELGVDKPAKKEPLKELNK